MSGPARLDCGSVAAALQAAAQPRHLRARATLAQSRLLVVLLFGAVTMHAATVTVTHTGDSGAGSLRGAIEAANGGGCAAPCTIVFDIPGSGPHTIAPLTALPSLSVAATIDGSTQPVAIDGANACIDPSQCRGLGIGAGATVRSLSITGFGTGIALFSTEPLGATLSACVIRDNSTGIELRATGVTIERNAISGNAEFGIEARSTLNTSADQNTIVDNEITGNGTGIGFFGTVQPANNVVRTNLIAHNAAYGIELASGKGCNEIRENSIHSNGDLGISDTGPGFPPVSPVPPCTVQRYPPVLEMLAYDAGNTTITGSFHGLAGVALTLDFYTNSVADPSGFGEGETYYASQNAVTDGQGRWSVVLPGDLRHRHLAATTGQSSFSNVLGGATNLRLTKSEEHEEPVAPGTLLRYTLTVTNLGPDEATNVRVLDQLPQDLATVSTAAGADWSCITNSAEVRCSLLQPLPAGAARSFVIEATPLATDMTIVNTAGVTLSEQDTNPADNSASEETFVRGLRADLAVEHLVKPQSAEAGSVAAYTLRVSNHGPDPEPAAVLTVTMSPGVTVQSTGSLSCNTSMNVLTCPLGEMPGGTAHLVQLALRAPDSGSTMRHTGAVAGGLVDPSPANNSSTVETELRAKSGRRRSARH